MRLFIAIELSEEMKRAAAQAQDGLRRQRVGGNYTPAENLHMTLAFIGELPSAERATAALRAVDFAPFSLTADGVGCFGDLWWMGVRADPALDALARIVRRALADAGVPFDRKRFRPHVTLLRRASAAPRVIPEIRPADMIVDRFCLYRSERGKNGMIYTALDAFAANRPSA